VFRDNQGCFHLLVTAKLENSPLHDRGGCLARFDSTDLWDWQGEEPFFFPGGGPGYLCVPECSDTFEWNGWHYLIFGQGMKTRYRVSRQPFGPWEKPAVDLLDGSLLAVMKTSPIWDNRRVGAGFIGSRQNDLDSGPVLWAGNIVLRELVQHSNGTLSTKFIPELSAAPGRPIQLTAEALTAGGSASGNSLCLGAENSQEVVAFSGMPGDFRLRCRVLPKGGSGVRFGLGLRGSGRLERQYDLACEPGLRRITLADQEIDNVQEIAQPFEIEVVCQKDIVDVCIDQRRCLINRLPELRGDCLFFFCENGSVTFDQINITVD
jgi:hypothetical protein